MKMLLVIFQVWLFNVEFLNSNLLIFITKLKSITTLVKLMMTFCLVLPAQPHEWEKYEDIHSLICEIDVGFVLQTSQNNVSGKNF